MDTPENQTPSTSSCGCSSTQPSVAELQGQVESLRSTLSSVLVLLLVVSGAFNLYLWLQYRFTSTDLKAVRPSIEQMGAEWNKSLPTVQDFVKRLADYSRTHPDFAAIANKYHLNEQSAAIGKSAPGGIPSALPGSKR